MYNWLEVPAGNFYVRLGPFFADTDQFDINVKGFGGHKAKPQYSVPPTLVVSQIALSLQSVVSRNADPVQQMVT